MAKVVEQTIKSAVKKRDFRIIWLAAEINWKPIGQLALIKFD